MSHVSHTNESCHSWGVSNKFFFWVIECVVYMYVHILHLRLLQRHTWGIPHHISQNFGLIKCVVYMYVYIIWGSIKWVVYMHVPVYHLGLSQRHSWGLPHHMCQIFWYLMGYQGVSKVTKNTLTKNTLSKKTYTTHWYHSPKNYKKDDVFEWVMSHMSMNQVTHVNGSCRTYEWVMSYKRMGHVTRTNESCHTHKWVMLHTCYTHERVMYSPCPRKWDSSHLLGHGLHMTRL